MAEIQAFFANQGVPLVAPGNVPTIRIRRIDTQALVVTDSAMTEIGDGNFAFTFAPVSTLEYSIRADGDPTAAGQTTAAERYKDGALSGPVDDAILVDIPAILAAVLALNDPTVAAIVAGVWAEPVPGAFIAGSAGFILGTNLDVAVSTRNSVVPMTAALSQTEHDATQALIVGLNDPSLAAIVAGVWSEPVPGAFIAGSAGFILGGLTPGIQDWTATEREEMRFRLGMTGVQTDPASEPDLAQGGVKLLDIIAGNTRVIDDGGGNYVEEHLDFATGLSVVRRYDLFGFDQSSQITTLNNPFLDAGLDPNAGFMLRSRTL